MRRSVPTRIPLQPSPAAWYDANGWRRGVIGPNGELLDEDGRDIPEPPVWRVFAAALVWGAMLAFVVFCVATAVVHDASDPAPTSTPSTYGPPTIGQVGK